MAFPYKLLLRLLTGGLMVAVVALSAAADDATRGATLRSEGSVGLTGAGPAAHGRSSVPVTRLARLTRGNNVSWLLSEERMAWATDAAIAELRDGGFRHLRLQVSVPMIAPTGQVSTAALAEVRVVVNRITAAGLGVVLSPHELPSSLWSDPAALAELDSRLAAAMSSTDPELVFLEVANEPSYTTAQAWNPIQRQVLAAMRAAAPDHTLIAAANLRITQYEWDAVAAATAMDVIPDGNVVYSYHFYEPFPFTHQGTAWAWPPLQHLRDLPYPSAPSNVAQALVVDPTPGSTTSQEEANVATARAVLADYGEQRWDAARVAARMAVVSEWAQGVGVPLYVGELGAYPYETSDHASRHRWLADVRRTAEAAGSGWAVWDDGWLRDSSISYRPGAITALGLPEPSARVVPPRRWAPIFRTPGSPYRKPPMLRPSLASRRPSVRTR